eukprot:GFUD01029918.1.p1 GENE.GFUD01029918.1~~GFUD01029918.1.p1  ORF type:complete len:228 (+),score=59.51 GFUD01029918.1:135-818(+)
MALVLDASGEAVSEVGQFVVLCERCNFLSEDLTSCSQCGNMLIQTGQNSSDTEDDGGIEDQQTRKREINPLGMYLRELKKSGKVDLNLAYKNWKDMDEESKVVYNEMSLKDKESLNSKVGIKEKVHQSEAQKAAKSIKKEKDAKKKAFDRKNMENLKQDVKTSKTLLSSMIAGKREALADIEIELVRGQEEVDNLSRELLLTEKLVEAKKEKLIGIKKEFKELFARK